MFDWLFNNKEKYWRVNNHKIRDYEAKILGTEVHGDRTGATARRKTKYECVHCEKAFDDRDRFKNVECYNVIYE